MRGRVFVKSWLWLFDFCTFGRVGLWGAFEDLWLHVSIRKSFSLACWHWRHNFIILAFVRWKEARESGVVISLGYMKHGLRKKEVGGKEDDSEKCLPCKHGSLSLDSQYPGKRELWGLAGQSSSWVGKVPGQWEIVSEEVDGVPNDT